MAAREDSLTVPTIKHAETAANVLVAEGAAEVLLFGSLADGRARPGSDIDLVAVFDDIDYDERHPRKWRLEARCAVAAGVPVGVHVTDRPEWAHRTGVVASSFEAAIAARSTKLRGRPSLPGAVDWRKAIGMPESDLEEAVQRLADVEQALGDMTDACRPSGHETTNFDGRTEVVERVRTRRLRGVCADAAMAIENSLKAWMAVNGATSRRGHEIAVLIEEARPLPDAVDAALGPLRANTVHPDRAEEWDDVSCWRIEGSCPSETRPTPEQTERLARTLTAAATATAEAVVTGLESKGVDPADERMAGCRDCLLAAHEALAEADPVTGAVPRPPHEDAQPALNPTSDEEPNVDRIAQAAP